MIRILIVDDHQIVRRGLKDVFADEFAELNVGEAETSKAALDLVMTHEWDIVLLDINIPGRSGLDVLEEIKWLRPRTPVLMVSAYPEEEFAIRSLKLGASGYLNKSRASDEVVAAAKKAMAGGKYVTASLAEKLAMGKTIKEAAAELSLSEKTVATYRSRISTKMGLASNVELTRYALKHGLVE
jgi:DNA-binding NarL/FixJ family response regulator